MSGFTILRHELLDSLPARLLTAGGYSLLVDFVRAWERETRNGEREIGGIIFTHAGCSRVIDRKAFNRARKELSERHPEDNPDGKGFIRVVNEKLGIYASSDAWVSYIATADEEKKLLRHEVQRKQRIERTKAYRSDLKADTTNGKGSIPKTDTTLPLPLSSPSNDVPKADTTAGVEQEGDVPKADNLQCPESGQGVVSAFPPDLHYCITSNTDHDHHDPISEFREEDMQAQAESGQHAGDVDGYWNLSEDKAEDPRRKRVREFDEDVLTLAKTHEAAGTSGSDLHIRQFTGVVCRHLRGEVARSGARVRQLIRKYPGTGPALKRAVARCIYKGIWDSEAFKALEDMLCDEIAKQNAKTMKTLTDKVAQ